jgi:hypothetical protein
MQDQSPRGDDITGVSNFKSSYTRGVQLAEFSRPCRLNITSKCGSIRAI